MGLRALRFRVQHWLENRVPGLITCAEFETMVDAYVDGELGPVSRVIVDLHLATCPLCSRYLKAYVKAREYAVDTLTAEESAALDEIPEDLITAILAARAAENGSPA